MGGRIVELLNSPHRAAEALMPWLIAGTLEPADRDRVEAHLLDCAACRVELERQRKLASLYRHAVADEPALDPGAAFARLTARIDAEAVPAAGRATWLLGWPLVAGVQLCVIAALASILVLDRPDANRPEAAPADYRGLAASAVAAQGEAIVFFSAEATAPEIRRVLNQAAARIVDGPTATGAYVLRFEPGTGAAALAALRGEPTVARVEPLALGDAPPLTRRLPQD